MWALREKDGRYWKTKGGFIEHPYPEHGMALFPDEEKAKKAALKVAVDAGELLEVVYLFAQEQADAAAAQRHLEAEARVEALRAQTPVVFVPYSRRIYKADIGIWGKDAHAYVGELLGLLFFADDPQPRYLVKEDSDGGWPTTMDKFMAKEYVLDIDQPPEKTDVLGTWPEDD